MNFQQNQNKTDQTSTMGIFDRTQNNSTIGKYNSTIGKYGTLNNTNTGNTGIYGNNTNTGIYGNTGNNTNNTNIGNNTNTGNNTNNSSYVYGTSLDSAIEKELFTVLTRIEKSYDPASSLYKFSHVFYNITDKPFERPPNFPLHLWNQALLPDRTLMPVILNREQINERRLMQNDLIKKLNESQNALYKKVEDLRIKREGLRDKLDIVLKNYRKFMGQYLLGDQNEDVYKLSIMSCERKKYWVKKKDEAIKCLNEMKSRLTNLDESVNYLIEREKKIK